MIGIRFSTQAKREFRKLDRASQKRICLKVKEFHRNPAAQANNLKTLNGGGYRLRIADWRVIFVQNEIHGRTVSIILAVRHRREAYR